MNVDFFSCSPNALTKWKEEDDAVLASTSVIGGAVGVQITVPSAVHLNRLGFDW
jgi:hypothetical protein